MENMSNSSFGGEASLNDYISWNFDTSNMRTRMSTIEAISFIPMSASRLDQYIRCPQSYKRTYLQGKKGVASAAMLIGSAIHAALETYSSSEDAESIDDFMIIVEGSIAKEEAVVGKPLDDESKETVRTIAQEYYEALESSMPPLGLEVPWAMPIGLAWFRGIIDRITILQDNPQIIEIRDFKSSKKAKTLKEMINDFQMSVYTMVAKEAFPGATIVTVLDYVRLGKELIHTYTDEELISNKKRIIESINLLLEDHDFKALSFSDKDALFKCAFCTHNTECGVGKRQKKTWDNIVAKRAKLKP